MSTWMEQYLSEAFGKWLGEQGRKGGETQLPIATLSAEKAARLREWEAQLSSDEPVEILLVAYAREKEKAPPSGDGG